MIAPQLGSVCKFTFVTRFSALNGVYKVVSLTTYEATVAAGIDYAAGLYTPAGLDSSQYQTDASSYAGQEVIVVQPPNNTALTYYIPLSLIALVPDPTVSRYDDIYLSVHIGMFKDPDTYAWVKGQIEDILSSVTGQTLQGQWLANSKKSQYLTEAEYDALDAERQANIKAVKPLSVIIQDQLTQITKLQALVAALEQTVISMRSAS